MTGPGAGGRPGDGTLRRDARANQRRLLDAAVTAIHREGPRVPMATIAAAAGVGVGTLYRRFPTREALLDALTHRSFQVVLDNVRAASASGGTALNRLDDHFVRTIRRRDELVLLPLHGGPDITTDLTRALRDEVHREFAAILEQGRLDGSIRDDATPRDVVFFGAMLCQPLPGATHWDGVALRIKDVYLDGLAARPGEPGGTDPPGLG